MDDIKNLGVGGFLGLVYGFVLTFAVMSLNRECFTGEKDDNFVSTALYIFGSTCIIGSTLGYKWNEPTTKAFPEIKGIEDGVMVGVSMSGVVLNFNSECMERGIETAAIMILSFALTGCMIAHCWKRAPQDARAVYQGGADGGDYNDEDVHERPHHD